MYTYRLHTAHSKKYKQKQKQRHITDMQSHLFNVYMNVSCRLALAIILNTGILEQTVHL